MKLLGNKILVHLPPNKSASGIIIPDSAREASKWMRGQVVAIGVGVKPECTVKVGDTVLFQHGFDTMDKSALGGLAQDDSEHPFAVEGELYIGSPEGLFAIVEKKYGKRQTTKRTEKAEKR